MINIDIFTMVTSFADINSIDSDYGQVDVYATMKAKIRPSQWIRMRENGVSIDYAKEEDKLDPSKSLAVKAIHGSKKWISGKKVIISFSKERV